MNALFIRGLTRESRHWHGLEKKFQLENPQVLVHSIDLPGAGAFYQLTSPTNLDEYVFFLREKLKGVKNSGATSLIGISMGGMIALRWAQLFPAELNKIFVINTSAGNLSGLTERFNLGEYKKLLGILLSVDPLLKEERILKLTTEKLAISKDILDQFSAIQTSCPVNFRSSFNQLWAASTFKIDHPLNIPTVVISALKDRLTSYKCSKILADTIGAELITHPDAGHDLPLDDPDWLLSVLRL
jgi:pimeloyl-ACP methyl ester carboxylesterase